MTPQCNDCGRWCRPVMWKVFYNGVPLEPDREIFLCAKCLERNGPFVLDPRIRPEHSTGYTEQAK